MIRTAIAAAVVAVVLSPVAAQAYPDKLDAAPTVAVVQAEPTEAATPTPEPTHTDPVAAPGPTQVAVTPTADVVPDDEWTPVPPRTYTPGEQACWDALVAQGVAVEDPDIDPCAGGGIIWTEDVPED